MAEPDPSGWCPRGLGPAAGLLGLGLAVTVALISHPGSSLFSWHPFLMTLAFSFFMTEAILLFSPKCSPMLPYSRRIKVRLHWLLQGLATASALLGLAAISYNKALNSKPHFTSWHSLCGLVTVMCTCLQSVGGIFLFYPKLLRKWSLAKLKLYHGTFGLIVYTLGSTSLLLGMCSTWFTVAVTGISWYISAFCPLLLALVIMNQITNSYLKKKRMQV